ncbi:MAG: hypothetical protein JWO52_3312 [Gammaproteobacteria bacterium]|nr:hypothetical protein [Gammaproteobacteria bacterium]
MRIRAPLRVPIGNARGRVGADNQCRRKWVGDRAPLRVPIGNVTGRASAGASV